MIDLERLAEPMIGDGCRGEPFSDQLREPLKAACAEDPAIWQIYSNDFGPKGFDASIDRYLSNPNNRTFVLFEGDELAGMSSFLGIDQARQVLEIGGTYYRPKSLLAAAGIASPAVTATANPPLRLEVHQAAGKSVIEVIGDSPVACSASYRLEVGDRRGGNRSVTSGTASIAPGVRHTFATVALGAGSGSVAKLDVQPCGGPAYQQSWPPTHS